jgi:hypothetical protein
MAAAGSGAAAPQPAELLAANTAAEVLQATQRPVSSSMAVVAGSVGEHVQQCAAADGQTVGERCAALGWWRRHLLLLRRWQFNLEGMGSSGS